MQNITARTAESEVITRSVSSFQSKNHNKRVQKNNHITILLLFITNMFQIKLQLQFKMLSKKYNTSGISHNLAVKKTETRKLLERSKSSKQRSTNHDAFRFQTKIKNDSKAITKEVK